MQTLDFVSGFSTSSLLTNVKEIEKLTFGRSKRDAALIFYGGNSAFNDSFDKTKFLTLL